MEDELPEEIQRISKFGIEIYRTNSMIVCACWHFRFVWFRPIYREDWTINTIFDKNVWQIEVGPATFVYIRSEEWR